MINYSEIIKLINEADAILIGAGAGLSTSAGIDYGTESFHKDFPELVTKYNMADMYTSSFYEFKTEEEKWSYWIKHIDCIYNLPATNTYKCLNSLFNNKNYFIITTNVDGQFLKAGFDKNKVFEVQGNLSKMQCSVGCHNTLYNDLPLVKKAPKYKKDTTIPKNIVPICPVCGKSMEVNLRKDAFFVEDKNWHYLEKNYNDFISINKQKNLLLIELGVGFNTPGIIRYPFEVLTKTQEKVTLLRINDQYADIPSEIKDKSIVLKTDCQTFIKNLLKRL